MGAADGMVDSRDGKGPEPKTTSKNSKKGMASRCHDTIPPGDRPRGGGRAAWLVRTGGLPLQRGGLLLDGK